MKLDLHSRAKSMSNKQIIRDNSVKYNIILIKDVYYTVNKYEITN